MSSPAVTAVDPAWLKQARSLVGLKEIVGSRHEPKVLEFFKEAGHPEIHNDETAWCAAFANAMLRRAGYAGTGALNARSFLNWGTGLSVPKPGCIVVFKRGNSTWEGHVAFFLRDLGDSIEVLGGNQGNAVSIARYSKAQLLGYRWPLIAGAKPSVIVTPPKTIVVQKPPSKTGAASAAVGGAAVTAGAAAASQAGVSAIGIIACIGGLSALVIAAIIIGYRISKGRWPWTSTGNQLPELSLPSLPQSDVSLELASAQLALSSEELPVTPLPQLSTPKPRRKLSAKPSPKTRTRAKSSKTSKRSAVKKSSPKRKSKSKS